jgi:hypothetical protein
MVERNAYAICGVLYAGSTPARPTLQYVPELRFGNITERLPSLAKAAPIVSVPAHVQEYAKDIGLKKATVIGGFSFYFINPSTLLLKSVIILTVSSPIFLTSALDAPASSKSRFLRCSSPILR